MWTIKKPFRMSVPEGFLRVVQKFQGIRIWWLKKRLERKAARRRKVVLLFLISVRNKEMKP